MDAKYLVIVIFLLFGLFESIQHTFFNKKGEKSSDLIIECLSLFLLFSVTQPLILFSSFLLMFYFFPTLENVWTNLSWGWALGLFLVFDDMMQYWWHRLAHTYRPLYKLHRAHHDAEYLSVRVVYRNNFFFYLTMPSIWFSGVLIYLGLGWFYAGFLIVKQTVIIASHSEFKWDKKLYEIKALHPLMWVIERTISTPSTHSGHHGKYKDDPGTHYKGNYGNLLFFWDILFGTAKITRQYPSTYGVEGLPSASWQEQLFWPLIRKPTKIDKTNLQTKLK